MDKNKTKQERTAFYRRKKGLFSKAFQLYKRCHTEIHILIRYRGRTYIFSSEDKTETPFASDALVRILYPYIQESNYDLA